jgi:hypothetical protein
METEEHVKLTEQASNTEESVGGNTSTFKPFLFAIAGLALIMSIFVLLPMLFTYFSEGNSRPPSQIHPADPVGKSDHTIYKSQKSNK